MQAVDDSHICAHHTCQAVEEAWATKQPVPVDVKMAGHPKHIQYTTHTRGSLVFHWFMLSSRVALSCIIG